LFQQLVVARDVAKDEFGAAHQADDPVQKAERSKAFGGQGHLVDAIGVVQEGNHERIENLQKAVGYSVLVSAR
jgi:hypothetical protein